MRYQELSVPQKQLYEDVWSIGISRTAEKYNTPYAKLKSSLQAADIPTPSSAYWSWLQLGLTDKAVKPPLPASDRQDVILYVRDPVQDAPPEPEICEEPEEAAEPERTEESPELTALLAGNRLLFWRMQSVGGEKKPAEPRKCADCMTWNATGSRHWSTPPRIMKQPAGSGSTSGWSKPRKI